MDLPYHITGLIRALENAHLPDREFEKGGYHKPKLTPKTREFNYIPACINRFCETLQEAVKLFPKDFAGTFVDVGCGIGSKLYLATYLLMDWEIVGIEKNPAYLKTARKVVRRERYGRPQAELIRADALLQDYSRYDIIYFYCPLAQDSFQQLLERRIIDTCRPGTVIIGFLAGQGIRDAEAGKKIERVGSETWRKL